jgi:hypothetical protein
MIRAPDLSGVSVWCFCLFCLYSFFFRNALFSRKRLWFLMQCHCIETESLENTVHDFDTVCVLHIKTDLAGGWQWLSVAYITRVILAKILISYHIVVTFIAYCSF